MAIQPTMPIQPVSFQDRLTYPIKSFAASYLGYLLIYKLSKLAIFLLENPPFHPLLARACSMSCFIVSVTLGYHLTLLGGKLGLFAWHILTHFEPQVNPPINIHNTRKLENFSI